jgi:hypothetical protein
MCVCFQASEATFIFADWEPYGNERYFRQQKRRPKAAFLLTASEADFYKVDSISKPQASRSASGMYLEFLFLRAHSRRRVDRMY